MKKELFNISKNLSILYVEDDKETQEQYKKIFSVLFKEVQRANNGQEALDLYKDNHYDLIFLDLTMPIMDGYSALPLMKEVYPKIKIIVVSADIQEQAKEKVISLGAELHIQKPINTDKMKDILELL